MHKALAKGDQDTIDKAIGNLAKAYESESKEGLKGWQAERFAREDLEALENARANLKMGSLKANPEYVDPGSTQVVQSEGQEQQKRRG